MERWVIETLGRRASHGFGQIPGFSKIKRALQMSLSEELFLYPAGYTGELRCRRLIAAHDMSDSEWAFMVFLSKVHTLRLLRNHYLTHCAILAKRPPCTIVHSYRTSRCDDGDDRVYQSAQKASWRGECPTDSMIQDRI